MCYVFQPFANFSFSNFLVAMVTALFWSRTGITDYVISKHWKNGTTQHLVVFEGPSQFTLPRDFLIGALALLDSRLWRAVGLSGQCKISGHYLTITKKASQFWKRFSNFRFPLVFTNGFGSQSDLFINISVIFTSIFTPKLVDQESPRKD